MSDSHTNPQLPETEPPTPQPGNRLAQATQFLFAVAAVLTAFAEVLQYLHHG